LIKKGCNVNVCDYDKRTPLHIAASNNNLDILKALLSVKNINVNPIDNFEMTPYHDALVNKNYEVAKLLSKHSGVVVHHDLGYKLCEAGFKGDIETLNALFKKGAELNTADYDLRTALHLAACEGKTETVGWLLSKKINTNVVDVFNNKPIDDARRYKHERIV